MYNSSQIKWLKSKAFMHVVQYCIIRDLERLCNWLRRLKGESIEDMQNCSINVIKWWLSRAKFDLKVFEHSSYFTHPESYSPKFMRFFIEMTLQLCTNFISIKSILHQEFNDDSLFKFHQTEYRTSFHVLFALECDPIYTINEIGTHEIGRERLQHVFVSYRQIRTRMTIRHGWDMDFPSRDE
jgi:hypothetical protein